MIKYDDFKKKYLENVYSINVIDNIKIQIHFNQLTSEFNKAKEISISEYERDYNELPENPFEVFSNLNLYMSDMYDLLVKDIIEEYITDTHNNLRIDKDGICLKSNLIGKACQLNFNNNMLGIVRGFDNNNPRYLFVDFGDEDEVKIDIDELIISEQKSK